MEKLSPEDISRAREWREKNVYRLKDGVKTWPLTADEFDDYLAAYSAAENERLTQELEQERAKTDVELEDRAEAAEAKCDRLKGALEKLVSIIPYQHCSTCNRFATEIQAALRPEGE